MAQQRYGRATRYSVRRDNKDITEALAIQQLIPVVIFRNNFSVPMGQHCAKFLKKDQPHNIC